MKIEITKKQLQSIIAYGMGIMAGKHNLQMTHTEIKKHAREGANIALEKILKNSNKLRSVGKNKSKGKDLSNIVGDEWSDIPEIPKNFFPNLGIFY